MTEDELVGWHHRLDGHESEQAPGTDDGQGSLACCSPWGHKELDATEQLDWTELILNSLKQSIYSLAGGCIWLQTCLGRTRPCCLFICLNESALFKTEVISQ